jgi:hypothetical protein
VVLSVLVAVSVVVLVIIALDVLESELECFVSVSGFVVVDIFFLHPNKTSKKINKKASNNSMHQ